MATETSSDTQDDIVASANSKNIKTGQAGDSKKNMTEQEMDIVGSSQPNIGYTSQTLANDLRESRKGTGVGLNPGYGMLPGVSPATVAMNMVGKASIENMAKAIETGGMPVYDAGNGKISVGYNNNMSAKDIVGVQHSGLFGGTVYSGRPEFNPSNFDKDGNYNDPFNNDGGDNQQSTMGGAVSAKKVATQKKQTNFAKAVNKNPQEQISKVRKPKSAGGEFQDGGALVRRTKTLQSDRRGILGKPDTGKKTLLGA